MSKQPDKDKYIIVTGGAGLIGSCLIRHLNNEGFSNVVVVDQLGSDERWRNLVGKRFSEIVPAHELFDWLLDRQEDIQAIIHLGACSDTTETDADYLLDNNTRYTIELAEYALKHNIRFIYASSAATYGDGSNGFSDVHEKLYDLHPLNMYGFSKHMVDLWAVRQGVADRVVGLKYFNVFGPNEWHKGRMSSVIPKFVEQVQTEGVVRLFKSSEPDKFPDGGQVRDHIYVKDAVRMTADFLFSERGGIYNVGRGQPTSWNEMAAGVFAALKKPEKIEYIEMPEDLVGKYQNYTCADMTKFGPNETTPIADAIEDYVCNHLLPGKYW